MGVAGCSAPQAFPCSSDAECDGGFCLDPGYCAFEDEACASGLRFGSFAGDLSGQCAEVEGGTGTSTSTSTTTTTTTATSTTTSTTTSTSTAAGSTGTPCPQGWWDCDWATRRPIDVDYSGGALSDFPAHVVLEPNRFDYEAAASDGTDVRFVLGDEVLSHELVTWDAAGVSELWVRLPELPTTGDLFVYYGNVTATDVSDPPSVWTADYLAVLHLVDETESLQALQLTPTGVMPEPGLLGTGSRFDGTTSVLDGQNPAPDIFTSGGTITVLFNATGWGQGNFGRFVDSATTNNTNDGYAFGVSFDAGGGQNLRFARAFGGARGNWFTSANSVVLDQWSVASVTFEDVVTAVPTFWVDGAAATFSMSTAPMGDPVTPVQSLSIGATGAADLRFFDGVLDEIHIATATRSDDWARAEYLSLTDQLLTIGDPEVPMP